MSTTRWLVLMIAILMLHALLAVLVIISPGPEGVWGQDTHEEEGP